MEYSVINFHFVFVFFKVRSCARKWSMAWGSHLTSPYPWSSSTPVSKLSSKRSAPLDFSWPSTKARPAPASKLGPSVQVRWFLVCNILFNNCSFSLNLCFKALNVNAAPVPWDTTHPHPSPQTANQRWATSLPPRPQPLLPPQSVDVTLTWTASPTSRSRSDAPPETHLEVTGLLKEAVEVHSSLF